MGTPIIGSDRARLAGAFAGAAGRYWLEVFPRVNSEVRRWQLRAEQIPDADLRRLALTNLTLERGNLEGAAAFAAFAPPERRGAVVRAQVSFQALYDYLDSLAEQPSADRVRNGRQLHRALPAALDPEAREPDYYAYHSADRDGGYLAELVTVCRTAFAALPSRAVVAASALRAAARMVVYQSLFHEDRVGSHGTLARWAARQAPGESGLRWWELAAAGASSLGVFALIAAAAEPALEPARAVALERAYFPWIGALHVLLDSLVDRVEDRRAGRHGLIENYRSPQEAAARLALLAARARASAHSLPEDRRHCVLLGAMVGHYLSTPAARKLEVLPATRGVLRAIGGLALPATLILGARRGAMPRALAR